MITLRRLLLIEALVTVYCSLLPARHGTQLHGGTKGCLELEESTARLSCSLQFSALLATVSSIANPSKKLEHG